MELKEAVETWLSYEDSDRYDEDKVKKVIEARITIREALRSGYKLCKIDEDCISREAVEKITWEEPSYDDALNVLTEVRDKVRALPSVTPQPKSGKWIDVGATHSQCDKCLAVFEIVSANGEANFCPNCGADMRGSEDEKMKFTTRKEQRKVIETIDAILRPLIPHLRKDEADAVQTALTILREVEVESEE